MFLDAHCDTVLGVVEDGYDFASGPGLHVTLRGLREADVRGQVFACFASEAAYPGRAREKALAFIEVVKQLCREHRTELFLCDSPGTLSASFSSNAGSRRGVVLALEGADPLEGSAATMREFRQLGVRLLTIAWDDNVFCGSSFGTNTGLSVEGEELVRLCEELGVVVDVSHASDAAFWDVHRIASRPFVASHSNCRAICGSPRNLTDDMIRAIADRGGVMGISLMPVFLSDPFRQRSQAFMDAALKAVRSGEAQWDDVQPEVARATKALPRPELATVVQHVRHAMRVGGEDCVGLGGDLDGIDSTPLGIDTVGDYPKIAQALAADGLTESQLEKVCWRNMLRVLDD